MRACHWGTLAAALIAAASVGAEELPVVAWNEWGIPLLKEVSVRRYREARAAGFTHLVQRFWGKPHEIVGRITHALDCAAAADLKLLIRCKDLSEEPERIVPFVRNHPALAMYCVSDEPRSSEFAKIGGVIRHIKAMDPNHPCYVNWFGILCEPPGTEHWCDLPDLARYSELAMKAMPIDMVSFDSYPIVVQDGACTIRTNWFGKLEFMRRYSSEHDLPFWGFALSTAHCNGPRQNFPIPTMGHLRFQVYANLMHGAKGIQYFTYWTPKYEPDGRYRQGPVTADGKRTFVYERVREMNAEIQARAHVFLPSKVVDLGHNGDLPNGAKRLEKLPDFVRRLELGDKPAVLAVLADGRKRHFLILNRDFERELSFEAEFARGTCFVRKDGTQDVTADYEDEFRLEPGGLAIFSWAKAGLEPPVRPEETPTALSCGDCGMTSAAIFDRPEWRARQIGTVRLRHASEMAEGNTSIGFEQLDRRMFDPERTYDLLAAAGIKHARCQTGWSRCEVVKGRLDFAWLDDIVANLRTRGIEPWFNVGFGNTNYMTGCHSPAAVGNVPLHYGEECRQMWLRYVRELARHYKGKVSCWEIWNEPNNDSFWRPRKPSAAEYVELLRLTAAEIKAEIPDAKIGGAMGGVYDWDFADIKYTDEFLVAGGARELDFWSVHAYGRMPERCGKALSLTRSGQYSLLRKAFDAAGGRSVAIWQGEGGYPSWLPKNHWLYDGEAPAGVTSQANQAKWLLRRFAEDFADGLERSSFYQAVDLVRPYAMSQTTQKWAARHGLLDGFTYRRKLSWWAMAHWNAVLGGCRVVVGKEFSVNGGTNLTATDYAFESGRRPDPVSASRGVVFRCRDGIRLVYHAPYSFDADYPGSVSASFAVSADLAPKRPVLVDLLQGGVYKVTSQKVRENEVCFVGLPLTDYPLALLDIGSIGVDERRK